MADRSSDASPTISVDEHRERILASIAALPAETLPLERALGRVLSDEVHSLVDVPGFDNSAMDGYAVHFSDAVSASAASPIVLSVVADLPAGTSDDPQLPSGTAARIMTGAPVPSDADCIVPIEDTDEGIDSVRIGSVRISAAPERFAHIRRAGADVRDGDLVLSAGRTLTARDLSAAASAGVNGVTVRRQPRVGVLSTGSELRAAGDSLARGQIHDSNSILIAAAVTECGGIPVQLGSVPDDENALRSILDRYGADVDAFVTSGGVSVGVYDIVKAVLAPLGVWFGCVRMQPGKPQGFGAWPGKPGTTSTPIFALPGNPVSVFVSFEQFVRPALLRMQGSANELRAEVVATASEGWTSPADRAQFMPVVVERMPDGALTARPASAGGSGSHLVASLARANAIARVLESVTEVRKGDSVDVTLLT